MENKIQNEIKDIAPTLASLDKSNPFKVPEGYFYSLENKVLDSMDYQPVMKTSVPDGYFDSLSDLVIERAKVKIEPKVVRFHKSKWLAIAASLIILFGTGYLLTFNSPISTSEEKFVFDIEADEALDYLIENDNIYLSDLLNFDIDEEDILLDYSIINDIGDTELEDILNELDQEDLEDLL